MRVALAALGFLVAQSVVHAIDAVPKGPDLDDLSMRVSESVYVIRGRVLEGPKSIIANITPISKETDELLRRGALVAREWIPGGALFTVAVDQTFCRQSDFGVVSAETAPLTGPVYVFVPSQEPPTRSALDPYRTVQSEFLMAGRDYLLFLRPSPGHSDLLKKYKLDSGVTYYRTHEGMRGAVALPDAAHPEGSYEFITPLVKAVTSLCDAVKAADVDTKVRNLKAIRSQFDDPAWRDSVDEAIQVLTPLPAPSLPHR
jgi:hypothetical protein